MFRSVLVALFLFALAILSGCSGSLEEPAMVLEAPISEAEPLADESLAAVRRSRGSAPARSGVLTAGDIDDMLNVTAFRSYVGKAATALNLPNAGLQRPLELQVTDAQGRATPGTRITIRRPGSAEPFWSGYAGVDGRLAVHPRLFGVQDGQVEVRTFGTGQEVGRTLVSVGKGTQTVTVMDQTDSKPDFVDLVFVVDATGSMGDELDWLTQDLMKFVNAARRSVAGVDIRFGLIVYRDHGDEYVVRNYGFTKSPARMTRWLRAQQAAGGGDYPEAAGVAMQAATGLNWRRGKGERLLFHVADAPPHNAQVYLAAAKALAQRDVQVFGLGASGVAAESEFLMRQAAAMNNGRYLFLTDDSGIGYGHTEPTISCYRVTRLTGLMTRVLQSELTGHRVEASSGDVMRDVGSYRRGVCLN